MRYLIGPVGQPKGQMTDRRTVMYTGKGGLLFRLAVEGRCESNLCGWCVSQCRVLVMKRQKETRRDNPCRWRWYICTT